MSLEKVIKASGFIIAGIWSGFLDTTVWLAKTAWKCSIGFLKFLYWILKIDSYREGFRTMCVTSIFVAVMVFVTLGVSFYFLNDAYFEEYIRDARNQ